ncbi:novel immune-type receptor 11a [Salvelinus fontinalis]|uniref:novel immune-type receptor 11a n=1 Tax=Salvelinus fontinalis TaxID=8038 RepID=UPI0024851C67|nr:novel immune-type receptor 11a [Salvelinus fontinalis]
MTVGASVNFSILLLLLPGALNSSRISQTPAAVIVRPKESSSLSCSHNTSTVFYMYWYRRPAQSRALTLVGYLYSNTANLETDFTNDRFGLQGNAGSRGDLQISDPTTEDSGEYFCATSLARCSRSSSFLYKNPSLWYTTQFIVFDWHTQ